jgi:hypothetical protein
MHHALGALAIIALVAWVFGERFARYCVGVALISVAAAFAYIMYRIAMGTI